METLTLPANVIDKQVEAIQHPQHKEHLHRKLGQLADVRPGTLSVMPEESEKEADVEKSPLQIQSEMLASFFAQASETLGPEASEDEVWEELLSQQLQELVDERSTLDKSALATNILVGNLLSVYGLDDQQAHDTLRSRMWNTASFRRGLDIIRVAHENIGLCVMTGDEEQPYRSLVEQTELYGGLLMATDNSIDLITSNLPVYELKDATSSQQAFLISVLAVNGNFAAARRNLEFVTDKRAMCEEMIEMGRMRREVLVGTGLDSVMSPLEVVDCAIDKGRSPAYAYSLSELGKDVQIHAFDRLLKEHPEKLPNEIVWGNSFTELGIEQLQKLLDAGFLSEYPNINLTSFRNLPSEAMPKLIQAGVKVDSIAAALPNFPPDEAKLYFQRLVLSKDSELYSIFRYPDNFSFEPRADFLQLARDTKNLSSVASAIQKYTDGSDKELIQELIDNGNADSIAQRMAELPALDVAWFVKGLQEKQDFAALISCLAHTDLLDQQKLFDDVMASDKAANLLNFSIKYFDKLDTNEILDRLIDAKLYDVILARPEAFVGQTSESIFERVSADPDALAVVAENLYRYPFVDAVWLIDQLEANGKTEQISKVADRALDNGIDKNRIWLAIKDDPKAIRALTFFAPKFVAAIGETEVLDNMARLGNLFDIAFVVQNFKDPETHRQFIDHCFNERDAGALAIGLNRANFPKEKIIERCCRDGWYGPLIGSSKNDFFKDVASEALPTEDQLVEWGAQAVAICNPACYPDVNVNDWFGQLLDRNDIDLLVSVMHCKDIESAPPEVAQVLLKSGWTELIRKNKEVFGKVAFSQEFIESYISSGDERFLELYDYAGHKIDWVERTFDGFGRDVSVGLLLTNKDLLQQTDEPLPADLVELSVSQRGQAGMDQLKNAFARIRRQLVLGTQTPEELESFVNLTTNNSVAESIARQLTRFSVSLWGEHGENEWKRILLAHYNLSPSVRPLPVEFSPSQEVVVNTIDAKEFDPTKLDEDAVNKFTSLNESLALGLEIADSPTPGRFSRLFTEAKGLLDDESSRLEDVRDGLVARNNQKAIENIDRQISSINSVRDMTLREFLTTARDNFSELAKIKVKGFDHLLRAGAFARAIGRSEEARSLAESLGGETATYERIVAMDDFVEHLVNNEVYRNYFGNDQSRKAFIGLSDTTALRKQISKTQSGQSSGQTTLQFVPSRGLLLELSGHIGDACWASKYESIASEFPNVTAIAYLRNPGRATERLVGAGLIFETTDQETGEDIVVLRGTNPIENYINGVKVEDFFNGLVDYVKGIAGDRRIAIVIDGRPGQAATNRPVLHTYLTDVVRPRRTQGTPIKLPDNTTFNDYVLSTEQHHPVWYLG